MEEFNNFVPIIEEEEKKSKQLCYKKSKKKLLVFFIVIIAISISFFFIIFQMNKDKDTDYASALKIDYIGKINCLYILENDQVESKLLGENFEIPKTIEIYIDGSKIDNIQNYKLKGKKEYNVSYIIHGELKMENMFKNIPYLVKVEMISENNCTITSMQSAFENCVNLSSFSIKGFDTLKIKSLKNLFYKTGLKEFDSNNLNTKNVKDMSSMFYECV